MDRPKDHVISILIADEPAAHERLGNVARRRAPGLVSVGITTGEEEGLARATLVMHCTPFEAEAFRRQVEKMIDVVEATVPEEFLGAQLALMRVEATGLAQASALDVLSRYGGRLLRQGPAEVVAQFSDLPERVEAALAELSLIGRTTAMRTGLVAMVA